MEDLAEGGRRLPHAIVPSDSSHSNSEVVAPELTWFGGDREYSDGSLVVEPPLFRR